MIFIGIDDTDMPDTRGTGRLARDIAGALNTDYDVVAVTRHQLSTDPRVPCTHKNSCAALHIAADHHAVPALVDRVSDLLRADFIPGSDPGLCVTTAPPEQITAFGRKAKKTFVLQEEARRLAAGFQIELIGLGGTEEGVIGALAAVGLAAGGNDGRYILLGHIRHLTGLQPVDAVLAAGVTAVQTLAGTPVTSGLVLTDKMRPARRRGQPVTVVKAENGQWLPLKLD